MNPVCFALVFYFILLKNLIVCKFLNKMIYYSTHNFLENCQTKSACQICQHIVSLNIYKVSKEYILLWAFITAFVNPLESVYYDFVILKSKDGILREKLY